MRVAVDTLGNSMPLYKPSRKYVALGPWGGAEPMDT